MNISVRLLREEDLPLADRIFRLAFGTFNGHPDPERFGGDIDKIRSRWRADPGAAFGAEMNGALVASILVTRWGSVGYFGPLTVRPDLWDRGIGQRLLEPTMELFAQWGTRHNGLYTYSNSPKHLALYQKYDFWPRFLTAIMVKSVRPEHQILKATLYSKVSDRERSGLLAACRDLTDTIYGGLDISREIHAAYDQGLGETLLIWANSRLSGFAVCHCEPRSEAGSNTCFIKFGAVRPGPAAGQDFDLLLKAIETFAAGRKLSVLLAGINTSRHEAYRMMLAQGYRAQTVGVAMHRPNESAYHHPGIYVIDDWR